jgi:hypothetical protein
LTHPSPLIHLIRPLLLWRFILLWKQAPPQSLRVRKTKIWISLTRMLEFVEILFITQRQSFAPFYIYLNSQLFRWTENLLSKLGVSTAVTNDEFNDTSSVCDHEIPSSLTSPLPLYRVKMKLLTMSLLQNNLRPQ